MDIVHEHDSAGGDLHLMQRVSRHVILPDLVHRGEAGLEAGSAIVRITLIDRVCDGSLPALINLDCVQMPALITS